MRRHNPIAFGSWLVVLALSACISEQRTGSRDGEVAEVTPELVEPETTGPEVVELDPEVTEVIEPEVIEPEVTEVIEPEVTEPEVTEVTEPEVTEVTEPEVTEVTEPEVTEPEVTEPEVTEPEVEVPPEVTEPEVTDAEVIAETTPEVIVEEVEVHEEVVAEPDLARIHGLLDVYFDNRFAPVAGDTAALVAQIAADGASIEQVESLIASGRSHYPDVSATVGVSSELDVTCDHVDYSSRYLLAVPASYDPDVPTPVIFVAYPTSDLMTFEAARESAQEGMNAFGAAGTARGAIVVAPITTRGWSPIGDSLVFSILSRLQRSYRIDPDAISVVGRGAGGHMAWRSGFTHGDRWSAVAPVNGGYETYVTDNRLRNLFGGNGFQAWSSYASTTLRTINSDIAAAIATAGLPWRTRYFEAANPGITEQVVAEISDFVVDQRRAMWPRAVYLWGGSSMRYDINWAGQTEQIYPDRAYRWNQKYWLEVTPNSNPSLKVDVSARVLDAHTIIITSNNVRELRVHLHPGMGIDFDQPLQIFVNDVVRYNGPIHQDIGHMLAFVREWDDPGRRFHGYVDITVPTDRVVPPPFGSP